MIKSGGNICADNVLNRGGLPCALADRRVVDQAVIVCTSSSERSRQSASLRSDHKQDVHLDAREDTTVHGDDGQRFRVLAPQVLQVVGRLRAAHRGHRTGARR